MSKKNKRKGKSGKDAMPGLAHSTKGIEKKKAENAKATSKHSGSRRLERVVWEGAGDQRIGLPPINGHTGIFAYHADDCLCNMGGWPCFRDGTIWSCCGDTDMHSHCSKSKEKNTTMSPKKTNKETGSYTNRIGVIWESVKEVSNLPPIRGHTGVFAYHMDDCMCGMGGWPCYREGSIWSCCGSTDEKSHCSKT